MAESSWQPVMSAAQRRRQRRLRSWWRHEQQSIAAALATSQHHSALRCPTWRLPVLGHAAALVTADSEVLGTLGIEVSSRRVLRFSGSGMVKKRIRINRKHPAHLVGYGIQCRPRVWKRLCPVESSLFHDPKRRCSDQGHADLVPARIRTGVGWFPGFLAGPHFQVCMSLISV